MYGSQILQGALGIGQAASAFFSKRPQRPSYQVPSAIEEAVSRQRGMAEQSTDMQLDRQQQQIGQSLARNTAEIKNVGKDSAQVLGALGSLQGAADNMGMEAENQFAQRQMQRQDSLNRGLFMLGQYQDKAFDYNQAMRYDEEAAARSAMIEGGLQNLFTAVDDAEAMGYITGQKPETPEGVFKRKKLSKNRKIRFGTPLMAERGGMMA